MFSNGNQTAIQVATVLLAEDEPMVRDLLAKVIRGAGYRLLVASSSMEAIGFLHEQGHEIDVLVTDVMMPHLNGRQLAQRVRDMAPDVRLLFISGYPAEHLEEISAESPVEFLQKPFAPSVLVERLRRLMKNAA